MERDIEKKLRQGIRAKGGVCLKWVSPGTAGVPDRIVILPGGRVVFVELKDETGRMSKQQKVVCRRLAALGCDVRGLRGAGEVSAFLSSLKEGGDAK